MLRSLLALGAGILTAAFYAQRHIVAVIDTSGSSPAQPSVLLRPGMLAALQSPGSGGWGFRGGWSPDWIPDDGWTPDGGYSSTSSTSGCSWGSTSAQLLASRWPLTCRGLAAATQSLLLSPRRTLASNPLCAGMLTALRSSPNDRSNAFSTKPEHERLTPLTRHRRASYPHLDAAA
jgi:hypothetical protein